MVIGWWAGLAIGMIFNTTVGLALLLALIGMALGYIWSTKKESQ